MKWFFFLFHISFLSAGSLQVEVSARSAILMNAESGAVLFEKQAHLPLSPASTTKIATALYLLERQTDLSQHVTVSRESLRGCSLKGKEECPAYWLESDGTMMRLKTGEILTLDALLHGLMLVSGNDAANVIAESIGGTVPLFMEQINEYLVSIGCKNTQFSNPHGLTHPEHWTTAYDLALITKKALKFTKFRQVVSTLSFLKPRTNKQAELEIKLTNPLLKPTSRYYYPKAIGVKSGYTQAAQFTLVAAAEQEGRTLIAVLLGCEQKGARYEDAKRLFEAAFTEEKAKRRLIGPEHTFFQQIEGAKKPLKATVSKPLSISFYPSEEPKCKALIHWNTGPLPIKKGKKVGYVEVVDEKGRLIEKEDLLALEELQGSFFYRLKAKLFR